MGFIRGVLTVLMSVLLLSSFLAMNFSLTLSRSLEFETLHPEVFKLINSDNEIKSNFEQGFLKVYPFMSRQCADESLNLSEVNLNNNEFNISVPCQSVLKGENETYNYLLESSITEYYYKDYNCSFLKCIEKYRNENPFFMVSEDAQKFWSGKFWMFLFTSIILFLGIVFMKKKRSGAFILGGSLLIISALPFFRMEGLFGSLDRQFLKFAHLLFSKSYSVFLTSIISGAALVLVGVFFKIFKIGIKIESFFRKRREKKEILVKPDSKEQAKID